jgi:hypothetical protein
MRAGIHIAYHRAFAAHDEAGELRLALTEPEPLSAGLPEVVEGAEPEARRGAGWIAEIAQSWPTPARNALTSTRSNRPARR